MSIQHLIPPWVASLVPYQPGKPIEEVEREYGIHDSIKLASNENPLGPSPKAMAALQGAIDDLHRYPDGGGFALKRRLSEKLAVAPEQLLIGNGSNEILELVARAFLRPGEEAVMSEQAFVVYASVVQAAAGIARAVPLRDFTHDLEAIGDAVSSKTRVVFLANPNNPTGTIYRRQAFEHFLSRLPPQERQILELRLEGHSSTEIAEKLGIYDRKVRRFFERLRGLAELEPEGRK